MTDKNKTARPKPQKVVFDDFPTIADMTEKLIAKYHPELGSASFKYICRSKSTKNSGKPVPGNVYRMGGKFRHLVDSDFVIEIALDCWNEFEPSQRTALIDHLLSRCTGIEDEQNGEMKWGIRHPEVQEFPEVASGNGCWNDSLTEMASCLK